MSPNDSLPCMTWHARPDMSCEHVNRAWLDYTGYTLEQALGEGWSRCLHPEDLARWLDTCVRAFDERQPFEIEYRLRRRDGEYRWVLDRAAPRFSRRRECAGLPRLRRRLHRHRRAQARRAGPRPRPGARATPARRLRGGEPPAPRPDDFRAARAADADPRDRHLGRAPGRPRHRAQRAHPEPDHFEPARPGPARWRGNPDAPAVRRARAGRRSGGGRHSGRSKSPGPMCGSRRAPRRRSKR